MFYRSDECHLPVPSTSRKSEIAEKILDTTNDINHTIITDKAILEKNYRVAFAEIEALSEFLDNAEQKLSVIKNEFDKPQSEKCSSPEEKFSNAFDEMDNLSNILGNAEYKLSRLKNELNITGRTDQNIEERKKNLRKIKYVPKRRTWMETTIDKKPAKKTETPKPKPLTRLFDFQRSKMVRKSEDPKKTNSSDEEQSENLKYTSPIASPKPSLTKQKPVKKPIMIETGTSTINFDIPKVEPPKLKSTQFITNGTQTVSELEPEPQPKPELQSKPGPEPEPQFEPGPKSEPEPMKLISKPIEERDIDKKPQLSLHQMPQIVIKQPLIIQKAQLIEINAEETIVENIPMKNIHYFEFTANDVENPCDLKESDEKSLFNEPVAPEVEPIEVPETPKSIHEELEIENDIPSITTLKTIQKYLEQKCATLNLNFLEQKQSFLKDFSSQSSDDKLKHNEITEVDSGETSINSYRKSSPLESKSVQKSSTSKLESPKSISEPESLKSKSVQSFSKSEPSSPKSKLSSSKSELKPELAVLKFKSKKSITKTEESFVPKKSLSKSKLVELSDMKSAEISKHDKKSKSMISSVSKSMKSDELSSEKRSQGKTEKLSFQSSKLLMEKISNLNLQLSKRIAEEKHKGRATYFTECFSRSRTKPWPFFIYL